MNSPSSSKVRGNRLLATVLRTEPCCLRFGLTCLSGRSRWTQTSRQEQREIRDRSQIKYCRLYVHDIFIFLKGPHTGSVSENLSKIFYSYCRGALDVIFIEDPPQAVNPANSHSTRVRGNQRALPLPRATCCLRYVLGCETCHTWWEAWRRWLLL